MHSQVRQRSGAVLAPHTALIFRDSKMKKSFTFIAIASVFVPAVSNAQSAETDDRAALTESWELAIEAKCKDPDALVDRSAFSDKIRPTIEKHSPLLRPVFVENSITTSLDKVQEKYPQKPSNEACKYVEELQRDRKSVSKTTHAPSDESQSTIYKCVVDGMVIFTDKKYKSIRCDKLDLPGYYPGEKVRATSMGQTADAADRKPQKPLSIADAKKIVSYDLRDPEATRFRDVFVSKSGNVCGQLNSKNAYGAYTGYAGFFVLAVSRRAMIQDDKNSGVFAYDYREACGQGSHKSDL